MIDNKYRRIYFTLCERALSRILPGYTEDHHIIPTCLGGANNPPNIIRLTAREHYIAHLCLVRCTEGIAKRKMALAVLAFKRMNKCQQIEYQTIRFTSRTFQRLREFVAAEQSKEWKGDRRFAYWTGKHMTPESNRKRSLALQGRKHSAEHVSNQAAAHTGTKHRFSEQSRNKLQEAGRIGALRRWEHQNSLNTSEHPFRITV